MNYDWFVFDLDGTLSQSEEGILGCASHAIDVLGYERPCESEMRRFIGPPLYWSFTELCGMDSDTAYRAIQIYRVYYLTGGWQKTRIYEGVQQLMRAIKLSGGHIAAATTKPEAPTLKILDYFGLLKYFDIISATTPESIDTSKKGLILNALRDCPDKSRAIMIGDTHYDCEGARDAGVDFAGVTYGYGTRDEFTGAKFIADDVFALADFLTGGLPRGMFVTFEGMDGCGKTTQFRRALEYLKRRGWAVVSSREPGGCPISEKIRDILLDNANEGMTELCEAYLYAASRAQHVREVINPALNAGKMVVCDRFLDSSMAYQGAGRELSMDEIRQINAFAVDSLSPDITFYYRAGIDTSEQRVLMGGAPDRMEAENREFRARVDAGYEQLCESESGRIFRIDSSRDIESVFDDTLKILNEHI